MDYDPGLGIERFSIHIWLRRAVYFHYKSMGRKKKAYNTSVPAVCKIAL